MDFQSYLDKSRKYYNNNNCCYHNVNHIKKMFQTFNKFENQFDEEFKEFVNTDEYNKHILFFAIAYHDAYYLPGFKGNEYISAKIAGYDLRIIVSPVEATLVKELIESTSPVFPFTNNPTPNHLILHDLDYSGFIDKDELKQNELLIISESMNAGQYKFEDIVNNRIKFYNKLLDKDLFKTKTFSVYNKQAKENIENRLNALK